jgi:hypothetical protein
MVFKVLRGKAGDLHDIPGMGCVDKASASYVYAAVADIASAAVGEQYDVAGLEIGGGYRHAVI